MNIKEYRQWVNVYNTGGWVVEKDIPQTIHGGAVVLLDDDLNAVNLRMYNEQEKGGIYSVGIGEATHTGERNNPLYDRLTKLVDPAKGPWKSFSTAVGYAVNVRKEHLRARINEKG